jgi:triacylglycerol lipase
MIRIILIATMMSASLGESDAAVGQRSKPPVLLVHGLWDSPRSMKALGDFLEGKGRDVRYIALTPNDGSRSIESLAHELSTRVTALYGSRQFDLVAFSMGGIVSRYYLEILGGNKQVSRLITVSTPNHGTCAAFLSNKAACVQMRPNSKLLNLLNRNLDKLQRVECTSIYTPLDLMIIPSCSSKISGWNNLIVWVLAHPLMLRSDACFRIIEAHLAPS